MSLLAQLTVGLLAGAAVGAVYFLWLWWTVQGVADRRRAGVWIVTNLVGRFALALACFGLLTRWGGWPVLVAALCAFVATRIVLLRRLAAPAKRKEAPT